MPKKARERKSRSCRDDDEYVKAAAWAWYLHGAGAPSKLISESDAQNRRKPASTTTRPSRFKLEADRLTNLNTTYQSLHTVCTKSKSLDGLDKSIVGLCQMLEFHEDEDVGLGDSSLLDDYEIVELTRSLEKNLSISVKKSAVHSEKSACLSAGLVHTPTVDVGYNKHKKKVSKASMSAVFKHRWTPAMCSMTDVACPGMAEIGRPNLHHHCSSSKKSGDSEMFHSVRQRLQQAVVLSPWKSPSRGKNTIRASSARRNSWDHGSS